LSDNIRGIKMRWKVVPIQGRQLKDVRGEDIFGDFRLCETYRGGGGYDQFPRIFKRRTISALGDTDLGKQFVVQLYGCPLRCPYCYVTEDGVFGRYVEYSTEELIAAFEMSKTNVFHLMGGAPALYLEGWSDIVKQLPDYAVFHSDLMLIEQRYMFNWLSNINKQNVLLAVNIKGVTQEDFRRNTQRHLDWTLFWTNLDTVVDSKVDFYFTFTNPDMEHIDEFKMMVIKRYGNRVLEDSYIIDLIEYDALKGDTNGMSRMR